MAALSPAPRFYETDADGTPLAFGKVYTYQSGTTTPLATYQSASGSANTNPVILDASGKANIWLLASNLYTFYVVNANDVPQYTVNNIGGSVPLTDLSSTSSVSLGDALVGFKQSNSSGVLPGATAGTVHTKLQEIISVKDFGAVGDGTDEYSEIIAAINASNGRMLHFPTPQSKYCYATPISIGSPVDTINMVGESGIRAIPLEYTGASASAGITVADTLDNFQCSNLEFNNSGSGTVGLQINCVRSVVERCSTVTATKWSTAVMSTYQVSDYSYYNLFKDCYLAVADSAQTTPIGILLGGGHTVVIDGCMFNGFTTGVKQQNGGSTTLYGLSVVNSRFEAFSGDTPSYPGGHNAIGIDVGDVNGLNISGCNFEMDGDAQVSAAGQRAIKLGIVAGGSISGNHFSGNGQCTAAINVSSSSAKNVVIQGNNFYSMNGYGIEATNTGQLYNVEIGANNAPSPTTGVYNDSFTPSLTFGGGSTGITYTYQVGRWKRTGKWITAQANIQLSNKGSSTGGVRINGFPVASSATTGTDSTGTIFHANMTGLGATQVMTIISTNSTQARMYRSDTGAEIADTAFGNTSLVQVQHTYLIDI